MPMHVHAPAVQSSPALHEWPHVPQCCVFVIRSAQAVVQFVVLAGHPQTPAVHVAPGTHE